MNVVVKGSKRAAVVLWVIASAYGLKNLWGSLFNSKPDGNSSPTEIPSIRGLQRAFESLKESQTASEKPQKPLREP